MKRINKLLYYKSVKSKIFITKNRISITILLITLISILKLNAQAPPIDDRYTVYPPNVASLGQYLDHPVELSTGVPNINIPIYTLEEGDLKLPISLSFHAKGIPVNSLASWVGTGWDLSVGGMVSRTVEGIPDDYNKYALEQGWYYSDIENWNLAYITFRNQEKLILTNGLSGAEKEKILSGYQHNLEQGWLDSGPDIFNYVLPSGFSGKFYFSHDKEVNFLDNHDNVKVEPLFNKNLVSERKFYFAGFKITDPAGNVFVFNEEEYASTDASHLGGTTPAPPNRPATSWQLSSVSSFDGTDVINFEYADEEYSYKSRVSCSFTGGLGNSLYCGSVAPCPNPFWVSSIWAKRLTKISCSKNPVVISFNASLREDTDNTGEAYKLDNIEIVYSENECKSFEFSYDYYTDTYLNETKKTRLKLLSLQEKTCDGLSTIPPFSFNYFENFTNTFPPPQSPSIDHWGYWNGSNNPKWPELTPFIIPTIKVYDEGGNYQFTKENPGINRESNFDYAKIGVLKSITYPTGGKTEYEFEGNRVNNYYFNPTVTSIGNTIVEENFGCNDTQKRFSMKFTQGQLFDATYEIGIVGCQIPTGGNYAGAKIRFYKDAAYTMPVGNEITLSSYPTYLTTGDLSDLLPSTVKANETVYVNIENHVANGSIGFKIFYGDVNNIANRNSLVGGLRIKKITVDDGLDNKFYKTFEYDILNNGYKNSTGKLLKNPNYGNLYSGSWVNPGGDCNTYTERFWTIVQYYDSSYRPLQNIYGRQLCYSQVKVYEGTTTDNAGYTIHRFIEAPETSWPPKGASWYNVDQNRNDIGLPIGKKIYNKNGKIVSSSSTEYNTYGGVTEGNNYMPFKFYIIPCAWYGDDYYCSKQNKIIRAQSYRHPHRYSKPKKETTISYDENGLNPVTNTTEYFYEKPAHRQLTKERSTNSDGKIYETHYRYYDSYNVTSVKNWLKTKNIIEPWRTIAYVYDNANDASATPVDGTTFDYNNFGTTGDNLVYYPKTFMRYERTWDANGTIQTGSWKNQHVINSYNTNVGKPTKITVDGWTDATIYTWTSTGKLNTKTFKAFVTDYNYHPDTDLLSSITEPDGQITTFTYDDFMRFDLLESRGGKIKKDYNYSYNPNFVEEIMTYGDEGTTSYISNTTKTIFDGLGRDIQIDQVGHRWNNPAGNPISVLKTYNNRGLLEKVYEPDDNTNITTLDEYTEYTYYDDPIGRVLSVKDPMGFVTTSAYGANSAEVDGFTAKTLMRETATDADGISTSVYTDKLGRVVANRIFKGTETSITYTNYDDKSRVTTIIPPGASIEDPNLIYKYVYDGADNVLSTKLPDKGLMEYRYDNRNLQTAMRDANIKAKGKGWLNTQYDAYGRQHKQGFGTSTGTVTDLLIHHYYDNSDNINTVNATTPIYKGKLHKSRVNILNGFSKSNSYLITDYTLDAYGRVSTESLTANHIGLAESTEYTYDMADNILKNKHTVGTTTATETFDFDPKGRLTKNDFELTGKGRKTIASYAGYSVKDELLIKKIGGNDYNNDDIVDFLQTVNYGYNYNGWLTNINYGSVTGTNSNCSNINVTNTTIGDDLFALDIRYNNPSQGHTGRKNGNISEIHWQVNGRAKNAYRFKYDFLNRLTEAKHYVGTTYQGQYDAGYSYDERGNIMSLSRNGLTGNGTSCTAKQIDNLTYMYKAGSNKLAKVFDGACGGGVGLHLNSVGGTNYNEQYIISDAKTNVNGGNTNNNAIQFKAGNYITLEGGFSYNPGIKANSKFSAVIDPCPTNNDLTNNGFKGPESSYYYDGNANLTYDSQKQLSIAYNHLNLPYKAQKDGNNKIEWKYTADGRKLQKKVTENGTAKIKNYLGNMEFNQSGETNTLEAAYHSEGRVLNNGYWEYNLKDHLDNVRLVFIQDGSTGKVYIMQENHYYPFGMQMNGYWKNNQTVKNDYLYNGKELNKEIGLNWSDYGARFYNAEIGRWISVDPLADFAPEWTPYRYGFNNPISYTDPDGLFESKEAAKEHAKKEKIRTGFFSKNKIVKNKEKNAEGEVSVSYSIENREEGSSISDFGGDIGIKKGVLASSSDIMSQETTHNFFTGTTTIATLRDGSTQDISPIQGTINLPFGPGGAANGLKTAKYLSKIKKLLPSIDRTGKVHGTLPRVKDLAKYSKDELKILAKELKKSVQQRIRVTVKKGREKGHGQRQGAEQNLIKSIEKHLGDRK